MNCVTTFNNMLRRTINSLLVIPSAVQVQQARNTFILKRRYPLRSMKLYRLKDIAHEQESKIYDLIEFKSLAENQKPIDLILTSFVEEVGDVGDRISVLSYEAYDKYLVPGLAVYATPENIKKYSDLTETKSKVEYSSPYVPKTLKYLQNYLLHVIMSNDNQWTLENWHIRTAFRMNKIHLEDDCITLPELTIAGPNPEMENKEFYVTLTINQREKVNVRCRLHLWSANANNNLVDSETFNDPAEPLYPEFQEVLDQLPLPKAVAERMQTRN
ncbi:39S ribosomal protein L9, mitochondrial [Chelonus insularis]|uniref:39S ribosomal protein L9, mitochondrial n=1 Tax=Chelonus insularis TaxID=460826 RepID=UPI00158D7ED9|nr:39S ribosomal protein L9, mitochondrial [Chelonus insularis]